MRKKGKKEKVAATVKRALSRLSEPFEEDDEELLMQVLLLQTGEFD